MPPTTVHLVRHAQGYHNISVANHAMHDPMLTPFGEEQCRALHTTFPNMDNIDCVIASPLKRTMYTALHSFSPVIQSKKLKVIALPELQETSDLPCDTGSDVQELEREFKDQPVDLGLMYTTANKTWNSKKDRWAPAASNIDARAKDAREWLYQRTEKDIVVVTHGGFLHYFTQDWSDTHRLDGTPSAGTGWANTEFRHYTMTSNNGEVKLVETPESRQARAGDEKPLSKEEQKNLQRTKTAQLQQDAKKEKSYQKAAAIQSKV